MNEVLIDSSQKDMEEVGSGKGTYTTTHTTTQCGLTAFNVVGKLANIIRLIIAIGLFGATVLTFLLAAGILSSVIGSVLYAAAVVELIGLVTILFDLSTAQWLVEKVLSRLTSDVYRLERTVDELDGAVKHLETLAGDLEFQLEQADKQIAARDAQLAESKAQLAESKTQLDMLETSVGNLDKANMVLGRQIEQKQKMLESDALIKANMEKLLKSMLDSQSAGEDMNEVFGQQISRLESAVDMLNAAHFDMLDTNDDGVITKAEFESHFKK